VRDLLASNGCDMGLSIAWSRRPRALHTLAAAHPHSIWIARWSLSSGGAPRRPGGGQWRPVCSGQPVTTHAPTAPALAPRTVRTIVLGDWEIRVPGALGAAQGTRASANTSGPDFT